MPTDIFQGTRFPEQGKRQQLQQMASAGGVRTSAVPARQPRVAAAGAQMGLNMGSPLQRLAGQPPSQEPITEGLSVGPGGGPSGVPRSEELMAQLTQVQRLAAIAQYAQTPHLRRIAAALLRQLAAQRPRTV